MNTTVTLERGHTGHTDHTGRAAPALRGEPAFPDAFSVLRRLTGGAAIVLDLVRRSRADATGAQGDRLRARARWLQRAAQDLCALHALHPRVLGSLPAPPFVLVANHLSYIDPVLLAALTPATSIAKQEVSGWPFIGTSVRDLGVIFLDRGCMHSGARALRGALRALEHGVSVLNFPEGTTTRGDAVLPFHRGIFGVARIAGVPIVPVALAFEPKELCWVGDQTFLPHYLRLSSRRASGASLKLGAPIRAEGSAAELAERARAAIVNLLLSQV
jgi:lyso-ornithine lipid O-acyltransferase